MGSYAQLCFSGYPVFSTKDYIDTWIFGKADRRKYTIKRRDCNKLCWCVDESDDSDEIVYAYEAEVAVIIKRLEVNGYTLESSRLAFNRSINEEISRLTELAKQIPDWNVETTINFYKNNNEFNKWQQALKLIVDQKIIERHDADGSTIAHADELVNHIVCSSDNSCPIDKLSYPCSNFNDFARAFLEVCDPESIVQLDATELVKGGWIDNFDDYENMKSENTRFFESMRIELNEIQEVVAGSDAFINKPLLSKMLYANAISALEKYLSSMLICSVMSSPALLRRTVESSENFKQEKFPLSDLFRKYDSINNRVREYLEGLLYHNIPMIKALFKSIMCIDFPDNYLSIVPAVKIRHDIVHRNGCNKSGIAHDLFFNDVTTLVDNIMVFAGSIDHQVKNIIVSQYNQDDCTSL
jgi:hypothetical protein